MADQSSELKKIKMQFWDLKIAVFKQMPGNLNEVKLLHILSILSIFL